MTLTELGILRRIADALEQQVRLMEESRQLDAKTSEALDAIKQEQAAHIESCEHWHKMTANRTGRVQ